MRWYSLKKHIPNISEIYVIRCFHKHDSYEQYFIASLEIYEDAFYFANWDLSACAALDVDKYQYEVTHFAYIEPVEIEE